MCLMLEKSVQFIAYDYKNCLGETDGDNVHSC